MDNKWLIWGVRRRLYRLSSRRWSVFRDSHELGDSQVLNERSRCKQRVSNNSGSNPTPEELPEI
uniref:Uncharacterized protein n=1 Tax=Arion vulgaris TaxID=1028688 RepID=A0A0B7A1Y8_9EUPU